MDLEKDVVTEEDYTRVADRALVALIQIIVEIAVSRQLDVWRYDPKILARMPEFNVKLGFGLHLGWAVEGALGSEYKIDASYLSQHVNMCQLLEEHTKEYGVPFLFSGELYDRLSPVIKARCRWLDSLLVAGRPNPLDIFTFDITKEGMGLARARRLAPTVHQDDVSFELDLFNQEAAVFEKSGPPSSSAPVSYSRLKPSSLHRAASVSSPMGRRPSFPSIDTSDEATDPAAAFNQLAQSPLGSMMLHPAFSVVSPSSAPSAPIDAITRTGRMGRRFSNMGNMLEATKAPPPPPPPPGKSGASAPAPPPQPVPKDYKAFLRSSTPTAEALAAASQAAASVPVTNRPLCASCEKPVQLPAAYFMCGHVLHTRCVTGLGKKCSVCYPDVPKDAINIVGVEMAPTNHAADRLEHLDELQEELGIDSFSAPPGEVEDVDPDYDPRSPRPASLTAPKPLTALSPLAAFHRQASTVTAATLVTHGTTALAQEELVRQHTVLGGEKFARAASLGVPRAPLGGVGAAGSAGKLRKFFLLDNLKGGNSDDLAPLQTNLNPLFVPTFNDAMQNYVSGDWPKAASLLRVCLEMCPNDKAGHNLMEHIHAHEGKAPPDWQGYRDESAGGH